MPDMNEDHQIEFTERIQKEMDCTWSRALWWYHFIVTDGALDDDKFWYYQRVRDDEHFVRVDWS